MRRSAAFFLSSFVTFTLPAGENCVPVGSLDERSLAFQAGERMDFTIHYKWGILDADVGSAYVKLDTVMVGTVPCFHCSVYGETSRFYSAFFRVKEDFQSWFSRDGLRPVVFYRDTHEGSYASQNHYSYLWSAPEPYIDAQVFNTGMEKTRSVSIPLKECTFDLPSLFFFARNIDMGKVEIDKKYPMTFAIDSKSYDVYFIFKDRCTVKVKGLGTVRCLYFQAQLLKGSIFNGDHDMDIYISDDGNRLPVLFGAPILIGEVEGRLKSADGLKHPFSSRIK